MTVIEISSTIGIRATREHGPFLLCVERYLLDCTVQGFVQRIQRIKSIGPIDFTVHARKRLSCDRFNRSLQCSDNSRPKLMRDSSPAESGKPVANGAADGGLGMTTRADDHAGDGSSQFLNTDSLRRAHFLIPCRPASDSASPNFTVRRGGGRIEGVEHGVWKPPDKQKRPSGLCPPYRARP
jgi:hypothetical protein